MTMHDSNDTDLISVIHSVVAIYDSIVIQNGKTMVAFCDKGTHTHTIFLRPLNKSTS